VVSFHFRNRERKNERKKERKKERRKEREEERKNERRGKRVVSFHFAFVSFLLWNRLFREQDSVYSVDSTQIRFISVDCPQLANQSRNLTEV
jgi:hypothetical protein